MLLASVLEKLLWLFIVAYCLCSIWFVLSLFLKKRRLVSFLCATISIFAAVFLSEIANKEIEYQLITRDGVVFQENENVFSPSEEYVISSLKEVTGVEEIQVAAEDRDPNGLLGADHGYTSAVFFSYEGVKLSKSDKELIDLGNDAGGCIESFRSSEDAIARKANISSAPFFAGYTKCVGTVLVRVTPKLPYDAQIDLVNRIGASLLSAGESQDYVEYIAEVKQVYEKETTLDSFFGVFSFTLAVISLVVLASRLIHKRKDIIIPLVCVIGCIVVFLICISAPVYNGNTKILASVGVVVLCKIGASVFQHIVTKKDNQKKEQKRSLGTAQLIDNNLSEDFDTMDGHQFEYWCAGILRKNGFNNVTVTQGSGDQGVDILAEKDGIRYAIQCKCYTGNLGNKPIQEVHAGKDIYNCHVGVVMTNSHFTTGAKEAAKRTNTLLWDRSVIIGMMRQASTDKE